MNLNQAQSLATTLMTQHGISELGWKFKFDRAKRRFGCCKFRSKTITLSVYLTELNDEQRVKNTILHEIAHALVGSDNGHNYIWQRKAIEIGCDGNRCYNSLEVEKPKGNYSASCPNCKTSFVRFRKPKYNQSCGKCSGGIYNPTYQLNWQSN